MFVLKLFLSQGVEAVGPWLGESLLASTYNGVCDIVPGIKGSLD